MNDALPAALLLPVVDPLLRWLAATALALLFAGAAYGKLRDLTGFRYVLDAYELLPSSVTGAVAIGLALTELALTVALCMPATWFISAWLAIGLLALYAGAMSVNLLRGRVEMNCGCMGANSTTGVLSLWLVLRNLCVMALGALMLLPEAPRALVWMDGFTLLCGAAALALVYRLGDQLIANGTFQRKWQDDHG